MTSATYSGEVGLVWVVLSSLLELVLFCFFSCEDELVMNVAYGLRDGSLVDNAGRLRLLVVEVRRKLHVWCE